MNTYFEDLCNELNDNSKKDEIECVREVIQKRTENKRDALLKIKIEAEDTDIRSFYTEWVMWFTLIISVMGLFLPILNGIAEWGQKDVNMIVYIVVTIFYSIFLIVFAIKLLKTIKKKKKSNIAKWRKYVLRVVEELLQEQK